MQSGKDNKENLNDSSVEEGKIDITQKMPDISNKKLIRNNHIMVPSLLWIYTNASRESPYHVECIRERGEKIRKVFPPL